MGVTYPLSPINLTLIYFLNVTGILLRVGCTPLSSCFILLRPDFVLDKFVSIYSNANGIFLSLLTDDILKYSFFKNIVCKKR